LFSKGIHIQWLEEKQLSAQTNLMQSGDVRVETRLESNAVHMPRQQETKMVTGLSKLPSTKATVPPINNE
jgi:hypothetical protein